MSLTQLLLLLFGIIPSVYPLRCYICGDSDLTEFGECSSQFQFDCSTYATRFTKDERIYCRTTRQRANNNTFTVMKECISEQDHYKTLPRKTYQLDEECDLVDIGGVEVAYCLCRSDHCNRLPIAEQFMAFEQKHPELFGDVEDVKPPAPPPKHSGNTFRTGEAPLRIQSLPSGSGGASSFAAPILNPPAIVPINDLRTQNPTKSSEIIEIRRSQLPSRASGIETEISQIAARPISNSKETEIPLMNLPRNVISEGTFVGSGPIAPVIPNRDTLPTKDIMKCIHCGDGNLMNEIDECKRQVQVECTSDRSMCYTRQISLGNGMYGMDKACILPEQLVNEFGEAAREEGCGSSNGGRVQYCACSSHLCNQISLSQQRQILNSIPPSRSRNVPELAAPELPVPSPPGSRLVLSTPQPPIITAPPTIPTTTTSTEVPAPRPIIPTIVHRPAPSSSDLRCISCGEADMTDPTADCSAMSEELCESTTRFCVTKQTQISTSSFAMEKKCLSEKDASVFLPGEKIQEGCATSEGGLVNFCICRGKLCNRASLLQQAQATGVRDSLEEQRRMEEEITKHQMIANAIQTPSIPTSKNVGIVPSDGTEINKKQLPPVFLDEDDELEVAKDVRTEDEIIRERQKEWANTNVNGSADTVFNMIFIMIIIPFLL